MRRFACHCGFVQDGHKRLMDALAAKGVRDQVRTEVESEFAPALQQAPVWQRWQLRREIERELKRRIKKLAPPDALY